MNSQSKKEKSRIFGGGLSFTIRLPRLPFDEKTMEDDFDFGKNLEKLILANYSSIASFARDINLNAKTVQEWCGGGARFPSKPEYLRVMAEALRVTVHELMFGCLDKNEPLGSALEKTEIHTGLYEITIKKVDVKDRGEK